MWWPSGRSPYGARHTQAEGASGAEARTGVRDKRTRYGKEVMPLSFETLGRRGVESQRTLEVLAQSSREFARHAVGQGRRLVGAWRLELERALLWAEADVLLLAVGAQPVGPTFARGLWKRAEQKRWAERAHQQDRLGEAEGGGVAIFAAGVPQPAGAEVPAEES